MAKNYEDTARKILDLIGGKDNITFFGHCLTRLRVNIKDRSLVNDSELKKVPGIVGAQWVGEQLQMIVGQEVENLYNAACKVGGIEKQAAIDEEIEEDKSIKKKFSIKNLFNDLVLTITACITPVLVVFTVGGLIKLIVALIGPQTFNLLPSDNDLLVVLGMLGDTCFRFFPVFVAYSAAKRFDANIPMALILACLLLSPTLIDMVDAGQQFTVYGIPVVATSYANQFLPSLLITYVLSKVEKFFKKLFPTVIRSLLYPLCTMLVMLPLALCVLGPIGTICGDLISSLILWLKDVIGPIATGLVGALFPLLIVTGMHHALNSAATVDYALKGFDSCVFAGSYFMDYQLTALCFALLIKSKKPEHKALALNCIATEGIGGISEPTIFGIMLRNKKNILYSMLGGFAAGFYIGIMNVNCYVLAPSGYMGVLAYAGGDPMNFVNGVIACAIAFVIPFVLALLFGCEVDDGKEMA